LDESEEVRKEFVDTFGKGKFFGELLIEDIAGGELAWDTAAESIAKMEPSAVIILIPILILLLKDKSINVRDGAAEVLEK
jgi:hypothetical protein